MQIRVSKKHIWICLLLCSLFFTSYISVFNTNGMISSAENIFDRSSISGGSEPSSMNGGINSGHVDFMATANSSIEIFISSLKPARWLVSKNGFNLLTAILAAQIICFIYSARLSAAICTQFNSLSITRFLHKKDGMK